MNRTEKEQYLREYEVMKKKGKPFFPYAIMKDLVMAVVVGSAFGPCSAPSTRDMTIRTIATTRNIAESLNTA